MAATWIDNIVGWGQDNADLIGAGLGAYLGSQGTSDQVTTQTPYHYAGQKQGVENFVNAAKTDYQNGPQQYYPNNTVADLDQNTIAGQNAALGTTGVQNQLGNSMAQGAMNLAGGGNRVGGFQLENQIGFGLDPSLQNAVMNPIMRNLEERTLPGMDLAATSQGAFGGTRQAQMKGNAVADATQQATEALSMANLQARQQSIGQRAGDISAQLQGRNQDINQNHISNNAMQAGMSSIPGAQQALLSGANTQMGIGQQRTGYDQLQIDADKRSFDFNQNAQSNAIDQLGNRMLMTPQGAIKTAEGQPGSLTNILGGAMTGYQLGGGFNNQTQPQTTGNTNPMDYSWNGFT